MRVSDFDYALPEDLIAQRPAERRTRSRLLHFDAARGTLADLRFEDLPALIEPRDAVVLNDTRVIKARLAGRKVTGGRLELFVERALGECEALALIRAAHPPRTGAEFQVGDGIRVLVIGREQDLYHVRFAEPVASVLERCGSVPLPPYITHPPDAGDAERYQTVYARAPGAVAAPTAGLHFDVPLLDALRAKGAAVCALTLHVGAGTFQPVRGENLDAHRMHSERYEIPSATLQAISGRRVLAVGTTVLRALEASAGTGRRAGETDLFIQPGYRFAVVDRLLTNFHLPRSTLLMLVAAFAGLEATRRAYAHAVENRYRFFSYGDAMLIERAA